MIHGDPYEKEFWETRTVETICEKYFQTIIDNTAAYRNFDTYAHIDYLIRYAPEKNKGYTYEKYASIIDKALNTIIEHDLALEINTAGYKYGLGQPNPQADILARYLDGYVLFRLGPAGSIDLGRIECSLDKSIHESHRSRAV